MEKFGNKKMKFVSVAIRIDLQVKLKFSLFSKFKAASPTMFTVYRLLVKFANPFFKMD